MRQPIADSIPWSFGTDEDVKGWTNAGIVDEDTQADMSEFAIAHDRIKICGHSSWGKKTESRNSLQQLDVGQLPRTLSK